MYGRIMYMVHWWWYFVTWIAPQTKNIKWSSYINDWQLIVWESNIRMWSASYPHRKKNWFFSRFKKCSGLLHAIFYTYRTNLDLFLYLNFSKDKYISIFNFLCQKMWRNFFLPHFSLLYFSPLLQINEFFFGVKKS